jgi:LacI family transcriptional regulator
MHEPVPPRLQDLADRLGVTKAAVSLALRNQPGVSAELRAAVKALAAKLDYRASPLLAVHMAQVRARRRPHYRATLALLSNQPGGLAGAKRSPRDLRYCVVP